MRNLNSSKAYSLLLLATLLMGTLVVASAFMVAPAAAASDWPMFGHDSQGTRVAESTAPDKMYCLWRTETGGPVFSSPAVVGGKVYIGSTDDNLYCLDGTTGSVVWKYACGNDVQSSPAVVGGFVYFGSNDKNVYCVTTSGSLVWKYATGDQVYGSPNVVNGVVYICSLDKTIYALNATNGNVIWKNLYTRVFYTLFPTYKDGMIFIGNDDKNIRALNATTGAQIWTYGTTSSVGASSAVVADGRVIIGSDDNNFYCINETTGALIWKYNTPTNILQDYVRTSAGYLNGKVYCGFAHQFTVLDAATGTVNASLAGWTFHTGSIEYSSPAISSNGKVTFGTNDLNVYLFDAVTGARLTTYWTSATVESSPAIADGKIYVGGDDDFVYCFAQITGSIATTVSIQDRPADTASGYIVGKQVFVQGNIFPGVSGVNVQVKYTLPDGTSYTKTVFAKADGEYVDTEYLTMPGDWKISASWNGLDPYDASASNEITVTVTGTAAAAAPAASAITCSASIASNGDISVSGAINPAVSGATVTLTYWKPDATSFTRTVTTGSDGTFTDSYTPDMRGNWLVRASWAGDASHAAAMSTMITAASTSAPAPAIPIEWIYVIVALLVIVVIAVVVLLLWKRK